MPRLVVAVGVAVWAVLAVLLRQPKQVQPSRLPPTSNDPVAAALANAHPVPRPGAGELAADDLRWIVSVHELESVDEVGHSVAIGLHDEVSAYADVVGDGLEEALAEQPGIDAADVDGDVVLVQSALALPDLHAAAIRALLAINQSPRRHRLPRYRPLPPSVMAEVADGLAETMADHGFVGRLRMGLEPDESHLNDLLGPGFYRIVEDHLVQVVRLGNDYGYHNNDGTITGGQLQLTVAVVEVRTTDVDQPIEVEREAELVTGERILLASYRVPATVDAVQEVLLGRALPWFESTRSRTAIVDRWVLGLPWHVPDIPRWEAADIAARWGFRGHARDLVRYGARGLPQVAAVAAKHRL